MRRLLHLTAILSLSAGEMQARTDAGRGTGEPMAKGAGARVVKTQTVRRVVFRTDPSRPLAPARPQSSPAPVIPLRRGTVRAPEVPLATKPRVIAPIAPPAPRLTVPLPPRQPPRELALQPTPFTPYDAYLGTVRAVIAGLDSRNATMGTACELMREGRSFRYRMTDPYRAQPPAVTEARRAGDCKSKALWLYDHLGDSAAYYTIGKLQRGARTSHAWVYWRHGGRWWILDPTDRATPISADSVSSSRYVPYYSYSRSGTFRHPATRLMLAMGNGIPAMSAVAGRAQFEGGSGAGRASRR